MTGRFNTMAKILLFCITAGCAGCVSTENKDAPLSHALAKAVHEQRISTMYMNNIIQEYSEIDVSDPDKGQRYANAVIAAIDRGGDSTKLDEVRRKFKDNGMP
jgi:hypothetical protein